MQLKFRIILNVEEDVLRDIVIDSNISLIEFSKIISSEFGFDSSEISTFHHSNENWEQLDEIKIFKIDELDQIMDKTPISNFFLSKGDKLIYIYDFLNYWTFFIELYEIDESVKIDSYNCINTSQNHVTLQGVTGSGKTFTVANVIQEIKKPTLVLAHNKTLAAQLYSEFQSFFPNNAVEYFVSYYDYYQPEAYIPSSGLYIEKDLSINEQIEKYRLSATSSLLSGRDDIIVVASVSCIYGIGNPSEFKKHVIQISIDDEIQISNLLTLFVKSQYSRSINELNRGSFSVKGDVVDIFPSYSDIYYRINFFGDTIESIESIDPLSGNKIENFENLRIFPAMIFVASESSIKSAINSIEFDLEEQVKYFDEIEKNIEAKRIRERTEFDLEMIKELGYCSGIENYSRYLDGRDPGTRPFCLLDYFPNDYLMVIDESHVTVPQVHAMYGGDRSRKENLVEYGFRLPAALDNRPLKFEEFEVDKISS